ncbi:MAG TPA: Nif3-like dinuclear metal center hexameric protein [Chitinophagaceae bacterium]|nr:Nif3-like dinuclear metal center hexameric protein [Chitinophagaceae bacterium]
MKIADIVSFLESLAHPSLQEVYDNAGLITGSPDWACTGILVSLDATEAVVNEARQQNCNLIVAHHPIVFGGLKKLNGSNYVEKTVITAIKNDIAIYAIHTNLDNVSHGVNGIIAARLGLTGCSVLLPKPNTLRKLFTFVPVAQAAQVREAIFAAGGGHIGQYSECSFSAAGTGTFKGGAGTQPFVGEPGKQHQEEELKLEVLFPAYLQKAIIAAMIAAHPYEEVAYDVVALENPHPGIGSGIVGQLPAPLEEKAALELLRRVFDVPVVRHTALCGRPVSRVAVCGGAGSFLISRALAAGVQLFVTADVKYHEFFDANPSTSSGQTGMVLADVGHFESEQFTVDGLVAVLREKFPTFATLKTGVNTNPVHYFLGE